MSRLRAAVVGLGRIGQEYDYEAGKDSVLTHAQAFAQHPRYELVGGVDPEARARERFTRKFGAPAFPDLAGLLRAGRPEVLALGVPTPLHAATLREALAAGPRAVICEKPLARSVAEGRAMVDAARSRGCALLVNYIRRFEPGTRELARLLRAGELGEIYKGAAWYSKGLRHNGTHMVDLLCFLLGGEARAESVLRGREWQGDPEPDAVVRFGGARIALQAAREEHFPLHGLELVGTRGVARYAAGGEEIEWRLDGTGEPRRIGTDLGRYQWHVAEALARHLDEGAPLASDGESALATLAIIEDIVARIPGPLA